VGIGGVPVDVPDGVATDFLNGLGHWTAPIGGTGFVLDTLGGKEVYQTIAALGATHTLDLANGNAFDATLTANCTLTFAGATAGTLCSFLLRLHQDGTGGWVTTWPGSVVWPGGSAPTVDTTLSTLSEFVFETIDGGTTWEGHPVGGGGAALGTAIPLIESGTGAAGTATAASHEDHVHPAAADVDLAASDHLHIGDIQFTGDGSTAAFELPAAPFDAYSVAAFDAGVRTDVTLSGYLLTTMTFGSAPTAGHLIIVDLIAAAA
jgi:hypothetical protein